MTVFLPSTEETDLRKIILAVQQLGSGRSNANGTFTCTTGAATTAVTNANCASGSHISITPTTANAAAEMGAGTIYISATAHGSFTVTHANSATVGRTFSYAIVG